MSKQRPPAFQLYARDFLTGTTAMSNIATGAYIRLLCHAWDGNPICTIPADDYSLFKLSGCDSTEEWNVVKAQVLAKFKEREVEGRKVLVNERLMAYFKELAEYSESKSKAAHARWDKERSGA
jgi:uncharacterized protein YdaU (DUF1376 family)